MQRVVSQDLWKAIRTHSRKAGIRKVAIAYVTRDLIGFRDRDILVVDASVRAIGCGQTGARLLQALQKKGVAVYHCADLHAKVLVLDEVAVVGSGNMSDSSAGGLVEAGLITDHVSTVSAAASFIEQLVSQSKPLSAARIAQLCRVKVVRRGGPMVGRRTQRPAQIARLGNRTWLVGVHELEKDSPADEQRMIDRAAKVLKSMSEESAEDPDWLRWGGRGHFVRHCRAGDSLIQIWRSSGAKRPSAVLQTAPILLKQRTKKWTRFYLGVGAGPRDKMPWGDFRRLLKKLGYSRQVGPGISHALEPEIADAIARRWKTS